MSWIKHILSNKFSHFTCTIFIYYNLKDCETNELFIVGNTLFWTGNVKINWELYQSVYFRCVSEFNITIIAVQKWLYGDNKIQKLIYQISNYTSQDCVLIWFNIVFNMLYKDITTISWSSVLIQSVLTSGVSNLITGKQTTFGNL